jgi:hypothetical protein
MDAAAEDAAEEKSCAVVATGLDASFEDGEPSCVYTLPCGLPNYLSLVGCEVYGPDDADLGCTIVDANGCAPDVDVPSAPGAAQIFCLDCSGSGRRPRGLKKVRQVSAPTAAAAYFARMAHDEAAAVHAFRRLRGELALHGAPAALVAEAERSAHDEEHHARAMARWARHFGATPFAPRVRPFRPRSLAAMAVENAAEGCVHETFGALVLQWQATHAQSPALRRLFARIAADETRHAALAWAVARWAETRLSVRSRARVAEAQSAALRSLTRGGAPSPIDSQMGIPSDARRSALVNEMGYRLGMHAAPSRASVTDTA